MVAAELFVIFVFRYNMERGSSAVYASGKIEISSTINSNNANKATN